MKWQLKSYRVLVRHHPTVKCHKTLSYFFSPSVCVCLLLFTLFATYSFILFSLARLRLESPWEPTNLSIHVHLCCRTNMYYVYIKNYFCNKRIGINKTGNWFSSWSFSFQWLHQVAFSVQWEEEMLFRERIPCSQIRRHNTQEHGNGWVIPDYRHDNWTCQGSL